MVDRYILYTVTKKFILQDVNHEILSSERAHVTSSPIRVEELSREHITVPEFKTIIRPFTGLEL